MADDIYTYDRSLLPSLMPLSSTDLRFRTDMAGAAPGTLAGAPHPNRLASNVASGIYFEHTTLAAQLDSKEKGTFPRIRLRKEAVFAIGPFTVERSTTGLLKEEPGGIYSLSNLRPGAVRIGTLQVSHAFRNVIDRWETYANGQYIWRTNTSVGVMLAVANTPLFMPINGTDLKHLTSSNSTSNEARAKSLFKHAELIWAEAARQSDPKSEVTISAAAEGDVKNSKLYIMTSILNSVEPTTASSMALPARVHLERMHGAEIRASRRTIASMP